MKHWYPVYTNPRAEKKAAELLVQNGIEVYLPLRKTLKQWSDRKKWVEEPLISSYLFVRIEIHEMAEVLMAKGVARFLYFSGKIASIPERQIEDLQRLLASETEFELVARSFKKSERVLVNAGPLMGMQGELIDIRSEKRLLLRIGETGQSILVQVPAVFLEKLPEGSRSLAV